MPEPNPYDLLGVTRDATPDEIGKAFRKAAGRVHPDTNKAPEADARFKELSAAYHLLNDPDKRLKYDMSHPQPAPAGTPWNHRGYDASSIMDEILGVKVARERQQQGQRRAGPRQPEEEWRPPPRGLDAHAVIEVTYGESVSGCRKGVKVRVSRAADKCTACSGLGSIPGTRRVACYACQGRGSRIDPAGGLHVQACRKCRGNGTIPLAPCTACGGTGQVDLEREITVTVPRGVKSGTVLRVAGMGGPGSPPGDLFLEVEVKPDPRYERVGQDLRIRKKVTLKKAMIGGSVTVDVPPDRVVEVEIPPGSQPGDEIRHHATVPGPGGDRLNVVVVLEVALPRVLSQRGRKLLEELCEELSRTEVV